jgi:hypothetical protein
MLLRSAAYACWHREHVDRLLLRLVGALYTCRWLTESTPDVDIAGAACISILLSSAG